MFDRKGEQANSNANACGLTTDAKVTLKMEKVENLICFS